MSTLKEHEAVLRDRCHNGTLYRNDEKLAAWLAVPVDDIPTVIDQLVSAEILRFTGVSSSGAERYQLGLPTYLTDDARRVYRVLLENATATDVVNITTVGELAQLASIDISRTRGAFRQLATAKIVTEETFGDHRFPVILQRFI